VHGHGDARADDLGEERHDLFGQAAQDDSRIFARIDGAQVEDRLRWIDEHAALHGQREERLLGVDVAQQRRRRDAELAGDVGERGGLEALEGEDPARGGDELLAGDGGWSAHL
jgi:hypothetical protein